MWSVSTILLGFYSFMLDTDTTLGSVDATTRTRRKFAAQSLEFNCRNKNFRECFPEYVELYEKELRNSAQHGGAPPASAESGGGAATAGGASSSGAAGTLQHGGKGGLAVDQQEPTAGMLMLSVSISLLLLAVILKLCT
jgi:ubiquitin-conjugating enzyme E2 J2